MVAPALFASLVISVGILVLFLANLLIALGAPKGTPGRDRFLQFLSPADLAAAAALVLAVALVALQRRLPGDGASIGPPAGRVRTIALIAGAVGAVVALAALLRGIVFLTLPHQPGAAKVGYFIAHLVVVAVAGAAAAWGLRSLREPALRTGL
jgi:hypothetical protein